MTRLTWHLIPHTHWDREWYLPRAAFEARLVPAVDRVVALLEQNPALRFHLDGQAILIEDYLAVQPTARSRVESLAGDHRLTLGPWYVLADQLIPSGESLLRNLLLGRAVAAALGGGCSVLYSPDAFGHSAAGPLLATEFGIATAVLWRGVPNAGGKDLVRWQGSGGRSVLGYHLPPAGYEFGVGLLGEEGHLAERWHGLKERAAARAAGTDVAVFVGADHHAPADRLLDLADRLRRLDPAASIRVSSLDEYFAALTRHSTVTDTVVGELRASPGHAWSLQGVHGTRSRMKRRHGATELVLLRVAEPLVALADTGRQVLGAAWRRLIQSQFHDTLAGSCADPVAAEQEVRLTGVLAASRELMRQSLATLLGHDADRAREMPASTRPALVLWNPTPRARDGVVVAEITAFREDVLIGPPGQRIVRRAGRLPGPTLMTPEGRAIATQILAVKPGLERIDAPRHYPDLDRVDRFHIAFECPRLGGLAAHRLGIGRGRVPSRPLEHPVRFQANTLGNGLVSIRFGSRGRLTIVDLGRDQAYHGLLGLEDRADRGDCYTPAIAPLGRERSTIGATQLLAAGPLLGAAAIAWTVRGPTGVVTGRTAVTLHAGSPIVRVRIDLDNQATDHRLRLHLPIGVPGESVAGAAFSSVRRAPGTTDRSWPDETRLPTDPGHRFVAVGRGDRGLALLAPGFFEYQWTPAGDLYFTVLRSVGELSKSDLPTRRGHAGWATPTPGAQELGRHRIELALLPIDEATAATPARLNESWEDAFLPPVPMWLRDGLIRRGATPAIELFGEGLVMEAMKPAEVGDAIVLRALNLGSRPAQGTWRLGIPIRRAERVRADESVIGPQMLSPDCKTLTFEAAPGELVSIRVSPALEAVRDPSPGVVRG